MATYQIHPGTLNTDTVAQILKNRDTLALSEESRQRILRCRKYLDDRLQQREELLYGINTGFGSLCNVKISADEIEQLQENLVRSHACGTGAEVPAELVKLMLLLKIQSLSYGHSAVDLATVWRLIDFYNHDITPVVYTQGSLGASGDLAPLAHLSLPLLGLGEVYYQNQRWSAAALFKHFNWQPLRLQSKEGLALLNGTQFMLAYATHLVIQAKHMLRQGNRIAALSLDAFDARLEPFHPSIHAVRPHAGQRAVAAEILTLLAGSEIASRPKQQVQDPYSFRCIPQVHGASLDALHYVESVVNTELSSVTDNPNVFPDEDLVLSGGNFHGQPLALALDLLAIALSEAGSIAERRIYQLISGQRGLPPFLIKNGGLHSGMMIPQYTAAALVSQNKQYCTPASVDSIVSSNGQEDHVSMGANAAVKCYQVAGNLENILAIELLNAAQALDFRRPLKSSPLLESWHEAFRQQVPFLEADRILHDDIVAANNFLRSEG